MELKKLLARSQKRLLKEWEYKREYLYPLLGLRQKIRMRHIQRAESKSSGRETSKESSESFVVATPRGVKGNSPLAAASRVLGL